MFSTKANYIRFSGYFRLQSLPQGCVSSLGPSLFCWAEQAVDVVVITVVKVSTVNHKQGGIEDVYNMPLLFQWITRLQARWTLAGSFWHSWKNGGQGWDLWWCAGGSWWIAHNAGGVYVCWWLCRWQKSDILIFCEIAGLEFAYLFFWARRNCLWWAQRTSWTPKKAVQFPVYLLNVVVVSITHS